MQYQRLRTTNARWIDFVTEHVYATAFHHPAWANLLSECYGYSVFVLTLSDDAGQVVAGLPIVEVRGLLGRRRWISLPFTDYCPPLLGDGENSRDLTDVLVQQIDDHIVRLEVRSALVERPKVHFHSHAVRHTLVLASDPDVVFRKFKKTRVQQSILKSQNDGVVVRRGETLADMRLFYALQLQTRWRLGVPVQPWRFFQLLWQRFLEEELGFLLLAYYNDVPVAASVFLAWNGTIIHKYSASNPEYWRLRPNNLILWTAIQWGCENGYHTFDFGRTDQENEGLRAFKSGWGTKEEPLIYSLIADQSPNPPLGRLKKAMTAVIQGSPVWVCRMIGEVFYKYAA